MAKKTKSVSKKTGSTKSKSKLTATATPSSPRSAPQGIGVWSAFGSPAFSTPQPLETMMSKSSQNQSCANDACFNPYSYMMNMMNNNTNNSWMPMMGSSANMNNPFMQQMMNMMNQFSSANTPMTFQQYCSSYTRNCNDAMKQGTEACMESAKACYDYACQAYKSYCETCQEAVDMYTDACRDLSTCKTPDEYARMQNEYAQKFYRQACEMTDMSNKMSPATKKSRVA